MGATNSSLRAEDPDWVAYVQAAWRSPRARELDELGGLLRPPVRRGQSFQKKLELLGKTMLGRADEIETLFTDQPQPKTPSEDVVRPLPKRPLTVREIVAGVGSANPRNKQINRRNLLRVMTRKVGGVEVAEWRVRMHAARRRTMLVIRAMVLMRSGVRRTSRLSRVDSFSYMIPDILGADCQKFIDQQLTSITARAEVEEACLAAKTGAATGHASIASLVGAGGSAARAAAAAAAIAAIEEEAEGEAGADSPRPDEGQQKGAGEGTPPLTPGNVAALRGAGSPDSNGASALHVSPAAEPQPSQPSHGNFQRRKPMTVGPNGLLSQSPDQEVGTGGDLVLAAAPGPSVAAPGGRKLRSSCAGRLQDDPAGADSPGEEKEAEASPIMQRLGAGRSAGAGQSLLALANAAMSTAASSGGSPVAAGGGSGALRGPGGRGVASARVNTRASYSGGPLPGSGVAAGGGLAAARASYSGGGSLTSAGGAAAKQGSAQEGMRTPVPPPTDGKMRRAFLLSARPGASKPGVASVSSAELSPEAGSNMSRSASVSGVPEFGRRPSTSGGAEPHTPRSRAGDRRPQPLHRSSWNGSTVFVPLDPPKLMAGGITPVGNPSPGYISRPKSVGHKAPASTAISATGQSQPDSAATRGGGGGGGVNALRQSTPTLSIRVEDTTSPSAGPVSSPKGGKGVTRKAAATTGAGSLLSGSQQPRPPTSASPTPGASPSQAGGQAGSASEDSSPSPRTRSASGPLTMPMHALLAPSSSERLSGLPANPQAQQQQQQQQQAEGSDATAAPTRAGLVAGMQQHRRRDVCFADSPSSPDAMFRPAPGVGVSPFEAAAVAAGEPTVTGTAGSSSQQGSGGGSGGGGHVAWAGSGEGAAVEEVQAPARGGWVTSAAGPGSGANRGKGPTQAAQAQGANSQLQGKGAQVQAQGRAATQAQVGWQQRGRTTPSYVASPPLAFASGHGANAAAATSAIASAVTNARRRLRSMDSYVVRAVPAAGSTPNAAAAAALSELQRVQRLMQMYVNRNNCAWADAQRWSPPSITRPREDMTYLKLHSGGAAALEQIAAGRLAFWLLVGEDGLSPPAAPNPSPSQRQGHGNKAQPSASSSSFSPSAAAPASASFVPPGGGTAAMDLWTSDPYQIMQECRRGLLHNRSCVKGFSLQTRVLAQLALALSDAGGPDALESTHIVLSINDDQQEEVVRTLWDYKFYGFKRSNVIIISQPRRSGYRYHPQTGRFVTGAQSSAAVPSETVGSGLAAMQLNWHPDAFVLSEEGLIHGLRDTALEVLTQRGVRWMASYRSRDLMLLEKESLLAPKFLAQAMWLHARDGTNIVTQAIQADSMATARALDSLLLWREGAGRAGGSNSEMRMMELQSRRMSETVAEVQKKSANKLAIGVQRYMFHVPSLKGLMTDNQHFRPKLRLREDLLTISIDIADLSSLPGAEMAVVQAEHDPPLLMSPKELDLMLPLVQQQDVDQKLLTFLRELKPQIRVPRNQGLKVDVPQPRHTTAVFLDGGLACMPAVLMALALARPTIDAVQLVMFVADEPGLVYGRAVMAKVMEKVPRTQVKVGVDIVVRGARSLMEAMTRFVSDWRVDLVVVPSTCLNRSSVHSGAILGSVALSILKRMEVPVLVATSKAGAAADVMFGRKRLRAMLLAEAWAMPMLDFMCERVLVQGRGDKLLLGQVIPQRICTRQQRTAFQCLMNDMRILAEARQIESVEEVEIDGIDYSVVPQAVDDSHVNLLALHLPPQSRSLPKDLIALLGAVSAGVLVMKGSGFKVEGR